MNIELVRRRVEAVCRRFPSETAAFSRSVLDGYNQKTDESTPLGSVECWRIPGARPEQWAIGQPGQVYGDDDAIWISVVWRADLPQWKHGDVCVLPDGVKRTVRNIQNRGDVRVFIQLAEVQRMDGFKIDASDFMRATSAAKELVKKNTLHYASAVAAEAQRAARADAAWVDRSGTARGNLTSAAEQKGTRTTIAIGGSAPSKAKHSEYDDYMEILEFGHESLSRNFPDLSIIYPTAEAIEKEIRAGFGDAALRGSFRPKLVRSRRAVRTRKQKFRDRYLKNTGYKSNRSDTFGGKLR